MDKCIIGTIPIYSSISIVDKTDLNKCIESIRMSNKYVLCLYDTYLYKNEVNNGVIVDVKEFEKAKKMFMLSYSTIMMIIHYLDFSRINEIKEGDCIIIDELLIDTGDYTLNQLMTTPHIYRVLHVYDEYCIVRGLSIYENMISFDDVENWSYDELWNKMPLRFDSGKYNNIIDIILDLRNNLKALLKKHLKKLLHE